MSFADKELDYVVEQGAIVEENVIIGHNTIIKNGTKVCSGSIIGDNCIIGNNCYIDYNVIIRNDVEIGNNTFIGARCILGEYLVDFVSDRIVEKHPLKIGNDAIIRSETIIYGENSIGEGFQTGHRVTIRENAKIGHHVRIGTLSDIQGHCEIGNYVNMHSNVHIGHESKIEDYVWIFPYVVLTNDPTPPSEQLTGVTLKKFAVVATGSVLLPGVTIAEDTLVAAGAIVTKDVEQYSVVGGNPAKVISDVRKIKNHFTGENVYPWRYTFKRGMPWKDSDYETWYASLQLED